MPQQIELYFIALYYILLHNTLFNDITFHFSKTVYIDSECVEFGMGLSMLEFSGYIRTQDFLLLFCTTLHCFILYELKKKDCMVVVVFWCGVAYLIDNRITQSIESSTLDCISLCDFRKQITCWWCVGCLS